MHATRTRPALEVSAEGAGVVSHAGSRLLADLADRSTLTAQVSAVFFDRVRPQTAHDPGRVLTDLAVMIADGGECISVVSDATGPNTSGWSASVAMSAPRCPTGPHRGTRRLALHLLRHRHRPRTARLARCPPPFPRPRRGPHPLRQGHRSRTVPVQGVRDQPGLVGLRPDRDRPARLDPNHPAGRSASPGQAEPKTLRYRLLHVAARLVRGQRRVRLKLDRTWRWAAALATAFARLHALPTPQT